MMRLDSTHVLALSPSLIQNKISC